MDTSYIYVSGVAERTLLFSDTSAINLDLGLPDSFSQVWIQDTQMVFGFNSSPHTVDLTLIAKDKINISENRIGESCSLKIGSTRFYGYVTHVDTSAGTGGYVTRVTCQDGRKIDLNKYLLHTEPLLNANLSNTIVVPKEINAAGSLYEVNSPLWLIANYGASYSEIYNSISSSIVKLPSPSVIETKLGNAEAYRWSFSMTPLFNAILQIFDDVGYDIYYYNNEIRLIDRSKSIDVVQTFLDSKYKISTRMGFDQTERPTKYTILGAKKEGGVGTISNVVQYQNTVSLGATELLPCWTDIEIMYHDNNGVLKQYKPTEDELKMALKGIEHWVYYKRWEFEHSGDSFPRGWMESRIDPYPYGLEGSLIEAALAFGGGRSDVRKVIKNRRSIDTNWLVQWYDSVSKHARTYYGKLYYCVPSEAFLRKCMLIEEAWVNDNVDNITVPDAYSPFYNHGKIRGFVRFNKDDVLGYGLDGTSSPVSYTEWNESADKVFIPITANIYSPSEDKDQAFPGITNTRLYITLPEIVVSGVEDHWMLKDLVTLSSFEKTDGVATGSGVIEDTFQLLLTEKDMNDPKMVILPMGTITDFFIPVQYNIRYGDDGSTTNGTSTGNYSAEIDDKFAPWTRENPASPISDMLIKTNSIIASNDIDEFFEAEVTGLPDINFFANFANEFYIPTYPFTGISIIIGPGGITSRYDSKVQINEILKANKIEWSRFKSRLDRIQHFANLSKIQTDMDLTILPQNVLTSTRAKGVQQNNQKLIWGNTSTNGKQIDEEQDVEQRSFVKAVKITQKEGYLTTDPNGGATNVRQELYRGTDDDGQVWPPDWTSVDDQLGDSATYDDPYATGSTHDASIASRVAYVDGKWIQIETTTENRVGYRRSRARKKGYAPCHDGYLRTGMIALYHQEDVSGTTFCYFTGGIPLEDARMARIVGDVVQDGDYVYANVQTIPHPADTDKSNYNFYKVPFASPKDALMQGYADGSIVPIMHNKLAKGASANDSLDAASIGGLASVNDNGTLRPESTHYKSSTGPLGTLYITNPPIMGAIAVTVITPPNAQGTNGTVAVVGKEEVQYGAGTTAQEDVRFIGCDPELVYEGDYGILTKGMNEEYYVTILKPLFTPYSSFGA